MIHTVKGFSVVNKTEVDVCLEFHSFYYHPVEVDNLISGSSTFSKSSLYIWKFSDPVLLKPSLKNYEHYLVSMWNECNCVIVWILFGLAFLLIGMKTNLYQSYGQLLSFPNLLACYCSTLIELSFRIWNSCSWNFITSTSLVPTNAS